jgi:hypothetical protein
MQILETSCFSPLSYLANDAGSSVTIHATCYSDGRVDWSLGSDIHIQNLRCEYECTGPDHYSATVRNNSPTYNIYYLDIIDISFSPYCFQREVGPDIKVILGKYNRVLAIMHGEPLLDLPSQSDSERSPNALVITSILPSVQAVWLLYAFGRSIYANYSITIPMLGNDSLCICTW